MKKKLPHNTTKPTPKKKKSDADILAELIVKKMGNVSAVARAMKLARSTIYEKIDRSERLRAILEDARERMLDDAEDSLGKAIRRGEAWAVCFALKTKGQSRGYTERHQLDHSANGKEPEELTIRIIDSNGKVETVGES